VSSGPFVVQLNRTFRPEGLRLLAIGAHSDDIEIGCGGTVLRLIEEGLVGSVRWVVLSATGPREAEARLGAAAFLAGVAGPEVLTADFRDGFFPYVGDRVKDWFEAQKDSFEPDLILTHRREDLHQDHGLVGELTWNTYRDHLILEYEIPKYDGDPASPNVYVELPEATCERKIEILRETFKSQASKPWFDPEAFRSLMRLRGMECRAGSRYAEGFTGRKIAI
jgi:LmbE family N-acetylglucosaminyl deacetylase